MQIGKLSEAALKRSVLRQLHKGPGQDVLFYGTDCALGEVSDKKEPVRELYSSVCAVPGFERDPGKLILAAANNLAAAGAEPTAFLVQAVLPPEYEEGALRDDMKKLALAAENFGGRITGGHTQVSPDAKRPIYSITGIGTADIRTCRQETALQLGWDLVVTGQIALGGTAALALAHEAELLEQYPLSLIRKAQAFEKQMAVGEAAVAVTHFGRAAVRDLSQGGIFNALWEMAERGGTGLEVDLKKIPVRQETIEICEYFDINPYYFYSAGALLVGVPDGAALSGALEAQGIPAVVIGRATDGNDRMIRNGEEQRYLDRPKQEEWYRFLANHSGMMQSEK